MTVYAPPAALVNSDSDGWPLVLPPGPARPDAGHFEGRPYPVLEPREASLRAENAAYWAQNEPQRPALGDNLCWRWLTIDLGGAGAGVPCLRPKGHSGRCGGSK